MKKFLSMILAVVMIFALAACNKDEAKNDEKAKDDKKTEEQKSDDGKKDEKSDDEKKDDEKKDDEKKDDEKKDDEKKDEGKNEENKDAAQSSKFGLEVLKGDISSLIANSKSVEEVLIKEGEKLTVHQGGDIVPGVYDLEILEGDGNIMADRVDFYCMSINWIGDMKSSKQAYPSVFRAILLEGDEISLPGISKIKLTAVMNIVPGQELRIGNYIVGKDILPGKYKLSTNLKLDEEYKTLGWEVEVYNPSEDDDKTYNLNPGEPDTVLELKEGEIITVDCDTSVEQEDLKPDDAKLIFTPQ